MFKLLAPDAPPGNVSANATGSKAIKVKWSPVPYEQRNGIIRGYEVKYYLIDEELLWLYHIGNDWNAEDSELLNLWKFTNYTINDGNAEDVELFNLSKFTNYIICVLAFTIDQNGNKLKSNCSGTVSERTLEDGKFMHQSK